jgi:hypothetical protein
MSPGTAESTGAGFSVGEAPGAATEFPAVAVGAVAVGAVGEVPADEDGAGEDGVPAGSVAVLAQAARTETRARAARTRWAVFIAAEYFRDGGMRGG